LAVAHVSGLSGLGKGKTMNDESELSKPEIPAPEKPLSKVIKRVWGTIPVLFLLVLLGVAGFLFSKIKSENEMLKAKKTGLHILEGLNVAVNDIDAVIDAIRSAENTKTAHDELMKRFNLSSRQAKAIILMPLERITGLKRVQIKTQIETIRREIAENKYRPQQKKPDVNVVTLNLVPTLLRDRINLPGFTEPWVRLEVLSEVHGKVNKIETEEGDTIRKGDIIAIIDSRDFENSYRSAKASYEAALATKKRLKELYKGRLSTRSDLDNATATAEQYKAAMDNIVLDIERCTIRAPISGIVNHLFIEKGQYFNKASQVVEILKIDRLKVRIGIPESDVDAVRKIKTFEVKIDALGGKTFRAKKRFLSKTAHNMARLYSLELALDNPKGEVLPDMFVRAEIVKKEEPEGIAVPLYAVISRSNEQIVYVVNDTRAHARKVELGFQEGWRVAITKGLSAGEQVVVMGQRSVNDGQKVNVIRSVTDIKDLQK